jgi:hypothetical protein
MSLGDPSTKIDRLLNKFAVCGISLLKNLRFTVQTVIVYLRAYAETTSIYHFYFSPSRWIFMQQIPENRKKPGLEGKIRGRNELLCKKGLLQGFRFV